LYTSVNIIRVTKSSMGAMGYVKCMGEMMSPYKSALGKSQKEETTFETCV
jgi:hypothetical protein